MYKTKYKLSDNIIAKYNFPKTKEKVQELMDKIDEYKYKCYELSPPKITPSYEVKYEMFTTNKVDKVGDYVEKKVTLFEKVQKTYDILNRILLEFSDLEKAVYNNTFNNKLSDIEISENMLLAENTIVRYRKSVTIKIAMAFDVAVLNY